jgi:hypothetical protein
MSNSKVVAVDPKLPRHVEIWGHIEDNNRFFRRLAAACTAWAFVALALACYALLVALYRPLAFHVDSEGEATFVGRLSEQLAPSPAEVRYVARQFLRRYIGFNSLTIERDLADAWNLMTTELRGEQLETLKQYQKEHGEELVAVIKKQQIQTVVDPKRIEVTDHNGKAWTVRLRGSARTWPLNRVGEDAAFSEREFESYVTLVHCPRTELTPNALLVAKVSNRFFVEEKKDATPPLPEAAEAEEAE